jgi:hypothetical protein
MKRTWLRFLVYLFLFLFAFALIPSISWLLPSSFSRPGESFIATSGQIDYGEQSEYGKKTAFHLAGPAILALNAWEISESEPGPIHQEVDAAKPWSSQGLPEGGYGTYYITLISVRQDATFFLAFPTPFLAERVFYSTDGSSYQHVMTTGSLSKDRFLPATLVSDSQSGNFSSNTGRLILAIEISYLPQQGAWALGELQHLGNKDPRVGVHALTGISFGIVGLLCLISVFFALFRYWKTLGWFSFLAPTFLGLAFLFSPDVPPLSSSIPLPRLPLFGQMALAFLFFGLFMTSFLFSSLVFPSKKAKTGILIAAVGSPLLSVILMGLLFFSDFCFLSLLPLAGFLLFALFRYRPHSIAGHRPFLLASCFGLALALSLALTFTYRSTPLAPKEGTFSLGFAFLSLMFLYFYFLEANAIHQDLLRAQEEKRKLQALTEERLVSELSPKTLNEDLNHVENEYRLGVSAGESYLHAFAGDLRYLIDASARRVSSLSDEVDHLQAHLAFLNQTDQGERELLYDGAGSELPLPSLLLYSCFRLLEGELPVSLRPKILLYFDVEVGGEDDQLYLHLGDHPNLSWTPAALAEAERLGRKLQKGDGLHLEKDGLRLTLLKPKELKP